MTHIVFCLRALSLQSVDFCASRIMTFSLSYSEKYNVLFLYHLRNEYFNVSFLSGDIVGPNIGHKGRQSKQMIY